MSTSECQDEKEPVRDNDQCPAPSSGRDPLGSVIDSFLARFRKGERPSLTEYIERFPGLADQIRELLPAMVEIEQLGSVGGVDDQASPKKARSRDRRPAQPNDQPLAQATAGATETKDSGPGATAAVGDSNGPWPQRLGDYRILGCIGQGGMGVVYEAVRESLKSRVALKVMHPRFRSNAGYLRRFHNEARSAAQLHHTNIVSVFDYGEHDGVCYYAMQYIAGHSLDEILADVRRLRSNRGGVLAAAVEVEPLPNMSGRPAPPRAPDGAARTVAASDSLRQTVTQGLLTGHFARGEGSALDLGEAPPHATEPIAPPFGAGIDASSELGFELGRAQTPTAPQTRDEEQIHTESTSGVSSSSLAGQGEDRYHREVARIGAQVADALAYAHKHGVLHRDVKPSNLLLDAVGNVWVTDFGLAKFDEGEDLSQSQDVVGTLRYMATERFRGVSDRRCDIYALGATLYELLTLRPVFQNDDRLRLIDAIVHEPPTSPRKLDHRIPRDLETIVLKSLAKDPNDRFATADELAAELRRFLENRPIHSRPTPAFERFWRWCKRNPGLAALNALAAALTTIIAIVSTLAAWTYYGQRNELRFEQDRTKATLSLAEQSAREARLALARSLVSEGAALQRTGLVGQRFESLERLREAARVLGADRDSRSRRAVIRNHAIAAMGLTDLGVLRLHDCGDIFDINVDAALKQYAVAEKSGEIVVHGLNDNHELVRLPGPGRLDFWYANPSFSPDGELLVARYALSGGRGDLLRVWHMARRELLGSLPSSGGLAFHPDGRRMLFGAIEGGIVVWDRLERRAIGRLGLDFQPNNLALDPAGRRIAANNSVGATPRVVILELETACVLADWRSQVGVAVMAWSADGQLLAVGSHAEDGRIYVWNVLRGELASVLQGHTNNIVGARFAHSSYLLATSSWDGTTRLWDGASGEPLTSAPGYLLGWFAPDDRRLAFGMGGKIGVWNVATDTECRTLHPGMLGNRTGVRKTAESTWEDADISPDGRLLATSDGDGVQLWEVDTGRQLSHLKTGASESVLFHADGQSLISLSRWGLYRWPIRPDPGRGPDAVCIGPPRLLRENSGGERNRATWLPDHRTLALTDNHNARVLLVDSGHPHSAWSRVAAFDSGENCRMTSVAVSPDGRWLAVGGWKEAGVRVWDLRKRRLERILRPKEPAGVLSFFVAFSPDSLTLVSNTGSDAGAGVYDFWRVGTWEPSHRILQERNSIAFQSPAFERNGRLMALAIAPDQVLLADPSSGRELARLTTLQPVGPTPLAFSPDGTKLSARTNRGTMLVWNLQRIRDQLAPMGLDWDAPPCPTASASDTAGPMPPPRPVRVIGEIFEPEARRVAELGELNRRLVANPDDADALVHRGWLFTERKMWPEAIADLERRVDLRPDDADALLLLAGAYKNTNNLPAARATFQKYLERFSDDTDARAMNGQVSLRLGRLQDAVADFTMVLDADPGRNAVRYQRAQILLRLDRFQEALADLGPLIERYPKDPGLYELRSHAHDRLGHRELAQADRKTALDSPLAGARHYNSLAWRLATGPAALRDPRQAVVLARKAVALTPGSATYLNTLGVALYRNGEYAESITTLEKSLAASEGVSDAFDLFFLAMARHRLGRIAQARIDFDRAVRWRCDHPSLAQPGWSEELDQFRAEAAKVLGSARA